MGLALLSTVLPGAGHLAEGRKRTGVVVLVAFLLLGATAAYAGTQVSPVRLLSYVVDTDVLAGVIVGASLLAIGWSAVIVSAYRLRTPHGLPAGRAIAPALVVGVLCLTVSTPLLYTAHYAYVGRDLIQNVFPHDTDRPAQHRIGHHHPSPWGDRPRINVLLLGGDWEADRTGVRTDSMTVASVDTRTGDTVLLSLPRNLMYAPMPPRLRDRFPDGFPDLLNAVHQYGADHPHEFPRGRDPGTEATREVIQRILGLRIDYYVLVNLDAFRSIVDALGGIDVYVDKKLPIGGGDTPVTKYLHKGMRHLDGYEAMWYARSRRADDDYHRMARQRCVLGALTRQATPRQVLAGFEQIAATAKRSVSTDIPDDALPALLRLGERVKNARISSLQFVPPLIDSAHPDYRLIRARTTRAIASPDRRSGHSIRTHRTSKPGQHKAKPTPLHQVCRYSR